MRHDWLFIWIIAFYFAAQTLLRTLLGGAFEVDEAEMFVMAQDYRLGYGPQPPLYNWIVATCIKLFGNTTFAITAPKNFLLFIAYALFFDGLKRLVPFRLAAIATLALLLLPNVSWEGQRAGSHTIAMLAAMAASFSILARRIETPGQTRHAIALGVALGIGGLTKLNFWLFPVSLLIAALPFTTIRNRLIRRDLWLSAAIATTFLAAPTLWMLHHPDASLASTSKLYYAPSLDTIPPWLAGFAELCTQTIAALALLFLTLLVTRLAQGKSAFHVPTAASTALWLTAAGLIGLILAAIGVVAFSVTDVQPRWLLPCLVPLAIGLMLIFCADLPDRSQRNLLRFCALLATLILAAMADIRLRGAGSDSLRLDLLAQKIDPQLSDGPTAVISSGYYYNGNLKALRPEWQALPNLPGYDLSPKTANLVIIGDKLTKNLGQTLMSYRIPKEQVLSHTSHMATLPYRFEPSHITQNVPYLIIQIKNGP